MIGVIPQSLVHIVGHKGLPDLRITSSMHERKALIADLSDGFIALPGGIGTFEELFEVWTWGQLGHHSKPCALLNTAGFYEQLDRFLDTVVEAGFLKGLHREMLIYAETPESLLQMMKNYKAPPATGKWVDKR